MAIKEVIDAVVEERGRAARVVKSFPKEKAIYDGGLRRMGRTRQYIICTCGFRNTFYTWSWAGHGKARCGGCGAWISYYTLEVKRESNLETGGFE